MQQPPLTFREVTQANWADMAELFESKGAPGYCWCMAWRPLAGDRNKASNAQRKQALQSMVQAGTPVGILAYQGDKAVAWCSIAPRPSHNALGGADYVDVAAHQVWSLTCFYVPRALRGKGIMRGLLRQAVETARGRGARIVEAYPVDPDSPSYRFMGFVAAFEQAGFSETGRAGSRRHVMHLRLS
ncbi:MAG: GNAT family N-acetyltransferase [Anaerolineales bacterium]|nr:GNAT family N-acetyltransferase [Anaerolineales bacterium]